MQKRQKIAHELILMRFHPFIYDVKTKGYNEIGINVFLGESNGTLHKKGYFHTFYTTDVTTCLLERRRGLQRRKKESGKCPVILRTV